MSKVTPYELYKSIEPFIVETVATGVSITSTVSGALTAHALNGPYHTGTLAESQAPWVATNIATAISNHAANLNAHTAGLILNYVTTPLINTGSGALTLTPATLTQSSKPLVLYNSLTPPTDMADAVLVQSETTGGSASIGGSSWGVGGYTAYNAYQVSPRPASGNPATTNNMQFTGHQAGSTQAFLAYFDGNLGTFRQFISTSDTLAVGDPIAWTELTELNASGTLSVLAAINTPLITTDTDVDLLINPAGTGIVQFPTAQTVSSVDFDSSFPIEGWRINEHATATGKSVLTIGEINADELSVRIFVADETRVDRGDEYWTKSYGIIAEAFTTPGSIGGTVSVKFEDSPALAGAIFTANDWVLIRSLEIDSGLTLYSVWGQVTSYIDNSDGTQNWTFTLRSGPTSRSIEKGNIAIDFGASGAALIHLSVIDSAGAPYIKMRRWAGANPYSPSNYTTYVQLGNLSGISNAYVTPSGDGIYIASTADEEQFIVADDTGLQLRNIDLKLYDSGTQHVNINAAGDNVWIGNGSGDKKLYWNGSTLAIEGSIVVTGGSGIANLADAGALATADDLDDVPDGSTYGRIQSTIIAGGLIQVGAGTKDSDLDGWHISGSEIVGQASGADQVVMGTDGTISAAAGDVWLDSNGVNLLVELADTQPSYLNFVTDSDEVKAAIGYFHTAGPTPGATDGLALYGGIRVRLMATYTETSGLLTTGGGITAAGDVDVTGNITLTGTVDGVDIAAFKSSYDSHNHDSAYVNVTGDTMTGTLTTRALTPSTTNTYNIGTSSVYYDNIYVRNLHTDTIVGTPSYSHSHDADYVNVTGDTMTGALIMDFDSHQMVHFDRTDNVNVSNIYYAGVTYSGGNDYAYFGKTNGLWVLSDGSLKANGNTIWHAGNDGSGSGLDADTLDGSHATAFVNVSGSTMTGNLVISSDSAGTVAGVKFRYNNSTTAEWQLYSRAYDDGSNPEDLFLYHYNGTSTSTVLRVNNSDGVVRFIQTPTVTTNDHTIWHAGNDGASSGLDADLLDGSHGSAFGKLADTQTWTSANTFSSKIVTPLIETSSGNLTLTPAGIVEITGTDSSGSTGPHLQLRAVADAYPQLQLLGYSHDGVGVNFDMYYDGTWRAADTTGYHIYKTTDKALIRYFNGGTPGSTFTFQTAMSIDLSNGYVGVATGSPSYQLDVNGITRSSTSVLTPLISTTSGNLTIEPASDIVEFPADVQIKSQSFASQATGWRITNDGQADFRYLYSDEMQVKTFVADLEQALAGGQIITKSVTTLSRDFTVPYPGSSVWIFVNDLPSASDMAVFESGDVIRLRQFSRAAGSLSITDTWGTVASYTDVNDEQRWTFTRSGSVAYNTIAQVAAPQTFTHAASTTLTINKVVGTASGHTMIAVIVTATATTITPPSGWTLIAQVSHTGVITSVYYKVAGGAEPASYTWTYSATIASCGCVAAYTNVSTVIYHGYSTNTGTSSTSMTGTSIEMFSNQNMLLLCGGASANVASAPPAGMTERVDVGVASIQVYMAEQLLSASGYTGNKTATLASAANSAVVMFGLLPTYTVTNSRGGASTPFTVIEADSIVLDYGVSGNGFHEVNAIDGAYGANSPYTQIVTWTTHPYDGKAVRMRMGNLNGLSISDYGLRMGTDVSATATTTFDFRASTGRLYLGDQTAGHLYYDGASLHLKSNTTNLITLDSSGSSFFAGVMTIGTNGEIRQGTGTLGSNFTGLRIWRDSSVGRIAGYNNATLQWYASTDGKMYAAGGDVWLDEDGVNLNVETAGTNPNHLRFMTGGTLKGSIGYYHTAGPTPGATDGLNFYGLRSRFLHSVEVTGSITLTGAINTGGVIDLGDDILCNGYDITDIGIIGDSWTNVSYGSGWGTYSGYQAVQYKKVGDLVFLRGVATRTSGSGTTIFTLPTGYRPPDDELHGVATDTGYGRVATTATGTMTHQSGGTTWVSMSNIVLSTT